MPAVPLIPSIPLLRFHRPEDVFAWREGNPVTAATFLEEVRQLAQQLPDRPHVLNLCGDRYRFVAGFAAAMLRGQISLLPPNHTPDIIKRLLKHYPELYCLTDSSEAPAGLHAMQYPELASTGAQCADMPAFPPWQVAAIVFTSGSTGDPTPNEKTWGSIERNVASAAARIGVLGRSDLTVLGTVPPQHMYGFESTAMIALQGGVRLHPAKPFFPADIAAALAEIHGPRELVTTPVHLRTLLDSGVQLPELELLVCATAPLSRELAKQAEDRYGAPLHEIYGFTEAGQVASRRTSQTDEWRTYDGLAIRRDGEKYFVSGGHVSGERQMTDAIELRSPTTFLLHGRAADLINIAGKRTSLASLNHHLNEIEGVRDGVFFMPDEKGTDNARLAAFVVAPGKTSSDILAGLRQRIDPVFLPRPLLMVDALPRNSTGKLPRASLEQLLQQGRNG